MKMSSTAAMLIALLAVVFSVELATTQATYAAASPQTCVSSIWDDTDIVHVLRLQDNKVDVKWLASGEASLTCRGGGPLDGQGVTVSQAGELSGVPGGILVGPTHIVIEFTSLGFRTALDGQMSSTTSCTASACTLKIDVQASGPHARLRGHETLTYDRQTKTLSLKVQRMLMQFQ